MLLLVGKRSLSPPAAICTHDVGREGWGERWWWLLCHEGGGGPPTRGGGMWRQKHNVSQVACHHLAQKVEESIAGRTSGPVTRHMGTQLGDTLFKGSTAARTERRGTQIRRK